jgi:hypothetical protein
LAHSLLFSIPERVLGNRWTMEGAIATPDCAIHLALNGNKRTTERSNYDCKQTTPLPGTTLVGGAWDTGGLGRLWQKYARYASAGSDAFSARRRHVEAGLWGHGNAGRRFIRAALSSSGHPKSD